MPPASEKIASLRHLLDERFPCVPRHAGRVLPTEISALDHVRGGLPLGAVTELVCSQPSSGGHLILARLFALTRAQRQRAALIDAADCFDPESLPKDDLVHVIWVRCQTIAQALQAADLLARDANLRLVCLDLRYASSIDLRKIPNSQWYRLQRAAEPADLALLVLTPHACVPSAEIRFVLNHSHTLASIEEERPVLTSQLEASVDRQRRSIATAG